jgi:hypothetical protein
MPSTSHSTAASARDASNNRERSYTDKLTDPSVQALRVNRAGVRLVWCSLSSSQVLVCAGRGRGQGWSARRRSRGRTTLEAGKARRQAGDAEEGLGWGLRSWRLPKWRSRGWWWCVRGARPYLGARASQRGGQDDRWGGPRSVRPLGLSGTPAWRRGGWGLAGAGRGTSADGWAGHAPASPQAAWASSGRSGGSRARSTGARASSPRPTRMWRARRTILRATDRVARLAVSRSRTWS